MVPVFIKENEVYTNPIKYILKLINKTLQVNICIVNNKIEAEYIFDHFDEKSIEINIGFLNSIIVEKKFSFKSYFKDEPLIYFPNSLKADYLSSVFYIVNCFQEHDNEKDRDRYGRFQYESSFQFKYNCIEENLIQKYLILFCEREFGIKVDVEKLSPTRLFLSHDIDSVNGAFLQDGLWAIKNGRFDIVLRIVFNEFANKPEWKNIDIINSLHTELGLKSAFFWLATNKTGNHKVKNADYNKRELNNLQKKSIINGLHKSSLYLNLDEELELLPFQTNFNRYHFLMFNLPNAWNSLDASKIKLDASLGFAERYGFRNGFGLPFKPYNLNSGKEYDFIEIPLNLMDGTFNKYMKIPVNETGDTIINFIEKNKCNSILSILWHNTFFTNYKYKGYLNEYKKILTYLIEAKLTSVTPQEIITEYGY